MLALYLSIEGQRLTPGILQCSIKTWRRSDMVAKNTTRRNRDFGGMKRAGADWPGANLTMPNLYVLQLHFHLCFAKSLSTPLAVENRRETHLLRPNKLEFPVNR